MMKMSDSNLDLANMGNEEDEAADDEEEEEEGTPIVKPKKSQREHLIHAVKGQDEVEIKQTKKKSRQLAQEADEMEEEPE